MQETENGKRKRSLGSARDDDTRVRFSHISFHPAAEVNLHPFGPPPSTGRRENAAHRRLPHMGRVAIGEYPFFQKGYKKTQPMRAALSDFKNYTLKRK